MQGYVNLKGVLLAASLVTFSVLAQAQANCDAILRDGVFQTSSVKENSYMRQQFAARLATMSKQQAESKVGGGLTLPIEGIPLGANYSEAEYKAWQQSVRQSLDVDTLVNRETEILTSIGDSVIVNGWVECLKAGAGGLKVTLTPQGETAVLLTVTWIPGLGAPDAIFLTDTVTPIGAAFSQGSSLMQKDSRLVRLNSTQALLARKANDAVAVVVNTSVIGGAAYLPRLSKVPAATPGNPILAAITSRAFEQNKNTKQVLVNLVGQSPIIVYSGKQNLTALTVCRNGVFAAFDGGGVYYSPDGNNIGRIASDSKTEQVYSGKQFATAIACQKGTGLNGTDSVVVTFSEGGKYMSRDGKNVGTDGNGTNTIQVNK